MGPTISPSEIIGIDPGVGFPAFAALEPRTGKLLRVESFRGDQISRRQTSRVNVSKRVYEITARILSRIVLVPGPKVVGIEGFIRNKGSTSIDTLGRFRQGLYDACMVAFGDLEVGWVHFEIPPATAKRAATGNGSAPKEVVAKMVERNFRATLSGSNDRRFAEADSVAIAMATLTRWNRRLFDVRSTGTDA